MSCSAASSSPTRRSSPRSCAASDPLGDDARRHRRLRAPTSAASRCPSTTSLFLVAGALADRRSVPAVPPLRAAARREHRRGDAAPRLRLAAADRPRRRRASSPPRSGDAFSRVWVSIWLAGGLAATLSLRVSVRLAAARRCAGAASTCGTSRSSAPGTLGPRPSPSGCSSAPWAGFNVVGFYDDDPAKIGHRGCGPPRARLARTSWSTRSTPAAIDQVWIALPLRAERADPRAAVDAALVVGRGPLRARHLQLPPAEPLGDRDRRPAGHLADRDADVGPQPGRQGGRGHRARLRCCSFRRCR